jgi:hypothetical protein
MASERDKGDRELRVFADFVKAAGLRIDLASVEKRLPPEPDLRCTHHDDGSIAFELVEICDPNLAQVFASSVEKIPVYLRTADPSTDIIRKKLRREYRTDLPIELLMYTDGRVITPPDVILPTVKPYLGSWRNVFRRAWLFAEGVAHRVWEQ